jgi:sugar phosphate isomerase/epimerase
MSGRNILTGICIMAALSSCARPGRQIVSEPYPGLKFGFTTQNFITTTPVSVSNAKMFIDFAKEQGYRWIELRDPDAILNLEECREIASYARDKNIEINYSVQRGLLETDFWDVFNKAVENTAVFEGPRYFRALAQIGAGEFGWSEEELNLLVNTANSAASAAADKGVGFTVENADTDIQGREGLYYGLSDFFERCDPMVTLQLDAANLFTGPAVVTPANAERFIRDHASRISYVHLKTARDGVPLTVLDDNPLDFETILSIMHENGVYYIAIELSSGSGEQQIYGNLASSIEYLEKKGLINIKK